MILHHRAKWTSNGSHTVHHSSILYYCCNRVVESVSSCHHYYYVFQRYLDEAERDKMQYALELKEYQQTEAYQITSAKIQDKKIKKGDNECLSTACLSCWSQLMHVFLSVAEPKKNPT